MTENEAIRITRQYAALGKRFGRDYSAQISAVLSAVDAPTDDSGVRVDALQYQSALRSKVADELGVRRQLNETSIEAIRTYKAVKL